MRLCGEPEVESSHELRIPRPDVGKDMKRQLRRLYALALPRTKEIFFTTRDDTEGAAWQLRAPLQQQEPRLGSST